MVKRKHGVLRYEVCVLKENDWMNIGVIGGADGPTAIFVTSSADWVLSAIIGALIVAGIIFAIMLKKRQTEK